MFLFLFVCFFFPFCFGVSLIPEKSFESLKSDSGDKFVIFYRSSESMTNKPIFSVLRQAAKKLITDLPQFGFYKCDGEREENKKAFEEAGFGKDATLFTATQEGGIQKYPHEVKVDVVVKHVKSLFGTVMNPELVGSFMGEENLNYKIQATKRPVFMKFYIDTCVHCKALKLPFQRFAKFYENSVIFMEVNCNSDAVASNFCSKNQASGYPTLILFTEKSSVKFEAGDRSFITIEKFLFEHTGISANAPFLTANPTIKPSDVKKVDAIPTVQVAPPLSTDLDQLVTEETFENLKASNVYKFVVFYRSSESESSSALKIIHEAAKVFYFSWIFLIAACKNAAPPSAFFQMRW